MNRILHSAHNSQRILQMVADTLILVRPDGMCIDIDTHSELWFLQEELLLGKNLFDLIPKHTLEKILPIFREVVEKREKANRNFRLDLKDQTYYFKCIMTPYDDMVLCQYRDITARNNVKLQLERANKELVEIQKAAQIGQWKYNTNDNLFYYWGHTGIFCDKEINSITLDEYTKLILAEDRPSFIKWLSTKKNSDDKEDCLDYRIKYDGGIYYIRLKAYAHELMPDGSFSIEGYIQNVTDIQRRRNDINTLTHAINNAKESIVAAKEDGTIIFANRQFKINHHISEKVEIESLKIYEIVGDMNTLESWKRRYRNAKPGESSTFIAYHPLKNNKDALAFEGMIYHVTSDEGVVSYWAFSHDISDRLRYESQIKRLNRIMDSTMQHLPANIVVKDINNDFHYLYYNRTAHNPHVSDQHIMGQSDFDFLPPSIAESQRQEDLEVARTGKELHKVTEEIDENGMPRILDKRTIKIESNDFSPMIINIEWDITQLELIKRELMVEKEKAERSDKLKSAFLANMSHEIRTPLNAIVGFSRIIAESEDAQERQTYYEIVESNNERLLTLINEILDLSKIESGIVEFTITQVKLSRLCEEIYDAHLFRCPPNVKLILTPSDGEIIIDTDKSRVFQVISNLIGNAFKFTEEGSVSYGYKQLGEWIYFHISDTGIGIAPDKVDRVFERFIKGNTFAQGTGLGLSICKTIIERLGGEIYLQTELGKGTTFVFTLPARKECLNSEELDSLMQTDAGTIEWPDNMQSLSAAKSHANKETIILIAEDTDSNYDLLKAILGKRYRLERAMNGMEAVAMFESLNPDLILMDIRMPILDGLKTTRIIRELSPDIPIIAQSAYAYSSDLSAAASAGCNEFISKPIAADQLKKVILKWLNRRK